MHRVAFKMKLFKGFEAEYKKRHDKIWPELSTLLKKNGIDDYSIFLDEETNALFGVLKIDDPKLLNKLPLAPVMQQWCDFCDTVAVATELRTLVGYR